MVSVRFSEYLTSFLSPLEWRPVEGRRLWPHPDGRWYQPDLWRHYSQYRCLRRPHQRRTSLCRRHRWWLGPRVNIWRSWAGDEGHTPGAAHGRLRAALHRSPPPPADVKTAFQSRPRQPSNPHWPKPSSEWPVPVFFFHSPTFFYFVLTPLLISLAFFPPHISSQLRFP